MGGRGAGCEDCGAAGGEGEGGMLRTGPRSRPRIGGWEDTGVYWSTGRSDEEDRRKDRFGRPRRTGGCKGDLGAAEGTR